MTSSGSTKKIFSGFFRSSMLNEGLDPTLAVELDPLQAAPGASGRWPP
jgi:hypothetical protein